MSLAVDLREPAPWLVHVGTGDGEMTWPFSERGDAEAAYRMAIESGEFTHALKRATRRRPAVIVTLVSLWHRTYVPDRNGRERAIYEEVPTS